VGTSKQVGGDRVSTISLLGCSTSVALAMGLTDEEGESPMLNTGLITQNYYKRRFLFDETVQPALITLI